MGCGRNTQPVEGSREGDVRQECSFDILVVRRVNTGGQQRDGY